MIRNVFHSNLCIADFAAMQHLLFASGISANSHARSV